MMTALKRLFGNHRWSISGAILLTSALVYGMHEPILGRVSPAHLEQRLGAFVLGENLTSRVALTLKLRMARAEGEQQLQLDGQLVTTPVDIHDGVVEVAYQLSRVRISMKGADSSLSSEQRQSEMELAEGLSQRFFVRHRSDGAAIALSLKRGYSPSFANILLAIVGDMQYVSGPQGESTWTAIERDANGEYLAAYARTGARQATKRKIKYLFSNAPSTHGNLQSKALLPQVQIERAAHEIVLNNAGRPTELHGSENVKVALGDSGLAFDTEVILHLTDGQVASDAGRIGEYRRTQAELVMQPIEMMSADPRVRRAYEDRTVLKGAAVDQIYAEMAMIADPKDARQTSDVRRKLEALFRLSEPSIAEVLARLPKLPEQQGKIAIDALSLAQTDAAQTALATVATNRNMPTLCREYAIRYLGHSEEPNAANLAAIRSLLDDSNPQHRQMARFTYGTLVAKISERRPGQAEDMVQELQSRLAAASSDGERGDLYLAFGNSAHPSALRTLSDATKSERSIVRGAAIEALGRIDDPRAVPLLGEFLKSPEEAVRMAALNAMQRRDLGPFLPALVEVAKHDRSAYLRSSAIELLGSQLRVSPPLKDVIIECAKQDPDAKVKQTAVRVLNSTSAMPT